MKTIAWDVDDTLNELTCIWLERWWTVKQGHPELEYDRLTENPPNRILGVELSVYRESLDEFRMSADFRFVSPRQKVMDWFLENGNKAHHLALTATPLSVAPISAAWVMLHFGRWIRSYNLLPSPRPDLPVPEYDKDKADFLDRIGHVDILVEDNPINAARAEKSGYEVVGIPQPWNSYKGDLEDALERLTSLIEG